MRPLHMTSLDSLCGTHRFPVACPFLKVILQNGSSESGVKIHLIHQSIPTYSPIHLSLLTFRTSMFKIPVGGEVSSTMFRCYEPMKTSLAIPVPLFGQRRTSFMKATNHPSSTHGVSNIPDHSGLGINTSSEIWTPPLAWLMSLLSKEPQARQTSGSGSAVHFLPLERHRHSGCKTPNYYKISIIT